MNVCAWLEWLGDSGCFGGWEFDGDRGLLKWESRIVGLMREPFVCWSVVCEGP